MFVHPCITSSWPGSLNTSVWIRRRKTLVILFLIFCAMQVRQNVEVRWLYYLKVLSYHEMIFYFHDNCVLYIYIYICTFYYFKGFFPSIMFFASTFNWSWIFLLDDHKFLFKCLFFHVFFYILLSVFCYFSFYIDAIRELLYWGISTSIVIICLESNIGGND